MHDNTERVQKPKDSLILSILSSTPSDDCVDDDKFLRHYSRQRECQLCKNKAIFTECESPCTAKPALVELKSHEQLNIDERKIAVTKATIPCSDAKGRTPLHFAVARCDSAFLSLLISLGADVTITTSEGHSLLWFAVQTHCVHIMQLLLQSGCASRENTLVHAQLAIIKNKPQTAQLLLHHGLDVNQHFGEFDYTLLHVASKWGRINMVSMLLAHGAQINATDVNNETALFHAIRESNYNIPPLLLRLEADVNHRNNNSETVLHVVAEKYDRPYMLNLLVRYGADLNALSSRGETPLYHSLRRRCQDDGCHREPVLVRHWHFSYFKRYPHADYATKKLLNYGAKVCTSDKDEDMPLHVAAVYGCPYVVQQLLDAGAYVHAKNRSGDSPLKLALCLGNWHLIRQMLVAGADPERLFDTISLPEHAREVFVEFQIAKRVALPGSRTYELPPVKMNEKLKWFEEACVKEVQYMETAETAKKGLTLLAFLRASRRCLALNFSRNRKVFLNFIDQRHYNNLPIYRDMLEHNFMTMIKYGPVLGPAVERFRGLMGNRLMDDISEKIIDKLNLEDLKNIINVRQNDV